MITLENVHVSLGKEALLHNINLVLEAPGLYGLFGLNGAGKTTFLRTMAGLLRKKGRITINHLASFEKNFQRQFFYFEFDGFLNPALTPRIYFNYTAKAWHSEPARIKEACELFEIDFLDKKIGKFSLGMKQKTILALYYISDAPLWLLDEPFNGLDFNTIATLEQFLLTQQQQRMILLSSHLIPQLSKLTEKIIFLQHKQIFYRETTDIEQTYYQLAAKVIPHV